jgi:hypothetical protein
MVKCTTCGNRWRAYQDRSLPEREVPEEEMLVEGPREPPSTAEDLEFVAAPVAPARKPVKKKTPVAVAVGAGVAVGLALLLGGAVVFRQQVADVLPSSAPIFAAVGLPVNTLGLVIEGVKSQPTFQAGRPVLLVTGAIRNANKVSTEAPPIRISLLGKDGKPVAGILAQPLNAKIPPGATRYFAVSLPDPPAGARELDIAFEPRADGAAATQGHAAPVQAPAAVEAQPLATDSPDALNPPVTAKHE